MYIYIYILIYIYIYIYIYINLYVLIMYKVYIRINYIQRFSEGLLRKIFGIYITEYIL